jgi:hypothetical protein
VSSKWQKNVYRPSSPKILQNKYLSSPRIERAGEKYSEVPSIEKLLKNIIPASTRKKQRLKFQLSKKLPIFDPVTNKVSWTNTEAMLLEIKKKL